MGDFISNKKIISLEWDSSFRHGQKGGVTAGKRGCTNIRRACVPLSNLFNELFPCLIFRIVGENFNSGILLLPLLQSISFHNQGISSWAYD